MPGEAVGILAEQQLPLSLPIDGNAATNGHLPAGRKIRDRMQFSFAHAGTVFECLGTVDAGAMQVAVAADLGPLPFTAESVEARQGMRGVVEAGRNLPGGGFSITARGSIRLDGAFRVESPVSPVALISGATIFVLEAQPYLERLATYLSELDRHAKPVRSDA